MTSEIDKQTGDFLLQLLLPIRDSLDDEDVTEIIFNKPNGYWVKTSSGDKYISCPAMDEKQLTKIARATSVYNGSKDEPLSYFQLPTGERCTFLKEDVCLQGYYGFLIRKHTEKTIPLQAMVDGGTFSDTKNVSFNILSDDEICSRLKRSDGSRLSDIDAELLHLINQKQWYDFLRLAIRSGKNIVVSGQTASGKTTLTRSIIDCIDKNERIITLEDVHELLLDGFVNVFPMIFGRTEGRYSATTLLEAIQRATPDRVFFAELRGVEAWAYLNLLNTGVRGSITSTHSGSAFRSFMRIATLAIQAEEARALGFDVVKREVFTSIDIVLQMHKRKVTEVFFDPVYVSDLIMN